MGWRPFSKSKLKANWAARLALISGLLGRVRQLEQQVQQLQRQIQTLTDRLAQNSHNSHRPPGSDGLAKPPPRGLRTKTGRKPGGQPGHRGHTLERVAQPDAVTGHPLGACPCGQCGGVSLCGQPVLEYARRQVFDLPPLKLSVTEPQAEIKRCPVSGRVVAAAFPPEVQAPVPYGPHFRGLTLYCYNQQWLPFDRLRQNCLDLFGRPPKPIPPKAPKLRTPPALQPSTAPHSRRSMAWRLPAPLSPRFGRWRNS